MKNKEKYNEGARILDGFLLENTQNQKTSYLKLFNENKNFTKELCKEDIISCIKTVMDPEIPVNLYDLGLIYSVNIDKNEVEIDMTLTNPNCPVADKMPKDVAKSLENLENLKSVKVNLVWEPKWTKDLMTEDAKLALDIF